MRKKSINSDFAKRSAKIRKEKGFTQQKLADAIGVSRRVITYYENGETNRPPAHLLKAIAKALQISIDELMGLKEVHKQHDPKKASLWKKLRRVEELPPAKQKIVLKTIDAFVQLNKK